MGTIRNHPELIQKILFLQRHSQRVHITPSTISSKLISIHLNGLCDCEFGIETKALADLVRSSNSFEITDRHLCYAYESPVGDKTARIVKRVPVFEISYVFDFGSPLLTAKLPAFRCLSTDMTVVRFTKNKLVLETAGYVSTRSVLEAQRVEGVEDFELSVSGKELKIVEELSGEVVMCYYKDCLVMFKFEGDMSTAVVIKSMISYVGRPRAQLLF